MPPKTFEVIMHIDGRPITFSANGQARLPKHDLLVVLLDDVEVALDATLQVDQHLGHLLRATGVGHASAAL